MILKQSMESSEQLTPLGKDQIDTLKQETSIVSPETENMYYKPVAKATVDFMVNNFGHLMRSDIRERAYGLEDRLIITDSEGFKKIRQEALKGDRKVGSEGQSVESDAFTLLPEGFMVLLSTKDQWEKVFTGDERKALIQSAGRNEGEVKNYFGTITMASAIIHETLHQFHDPRLPYNFAEFGITFYEGKIIPQLGLPDLTKSRKAVYLFRSLYAHLIEKFGDDVHKLFFNIDSLTPENKILIGGAMKKVTDDIFGNLE